MKRITALLLILILIMGTLPVMAEVQREIWVTSPGITCGVTSDDVMLNKAIHMGVARFYKLSSIGPNYYLAVAEEKISDGGINANRDHSYLTYYSVLETEDSYIILGKVETCNEYVQDGLEEVLDISGEIDVNYYKNSGCEAPYYIANPRRKYTCSSWEEFNEYIIIGSNGGIACISDGNDSSEARTPYIYGRKFYTGVDRYVSKDRTYFYYLSDGKTKAFTMNLVGIKNNTLTTISSSKIATSSVTEENGYIKYYDDEYTGNMTYSSKGYHLDNKFSDGRYAKGHWVNNGGNYEIWYDIYSASGILLSTGATGFSTNESSLYKSVIRAFVINDTKIIMCVDNLSNSWINEYYRAAVVTENEDGIIEVPRPIGKKNIVAPGSSETIPVSSTVDFASDDLALGFNIKENIIGTNKLTSGLREQVNSIRLDPITIVIKEGSVRGKWNTGISLPSYNNHDYSYSSGDTSVYFHSNGSTFNWSCSNPEKLIPGTYHKMYYVDGKSFYVKVNIIAPPSNDSETTVVF